MRQELGSAQPSRPNAERPRIEKPKRKQESKQPAAEIQLPDIVTVSTLAQLLGVPLAEVERNLSELRAAPDSDQDVVSFTNSELVAMALGRAVTFSKEVQVRARPYQQGVPLGVKSQRNHRH